MSITCSKQNAGHYPKKRHLNEGIKKPRLEFNLGLALIGLRTTGTCLFPKAIENSSISDMEFNSILHEIEQYKSLKRQL